MARKRFSRLIRIFTGTNCGAENELLHLEGRLEDFVHFWVMVVNSFNRNRGFIRASALAFTTLLALIPLLAVMVSVTSSFLKGQGEDSIYHGIDRFVSVMVPPAPLDTNDFVLHNHRHKTLSEEATTVETNSPVLTNNLAGVEMTNGMVLSPTNEVRITAQKEAARSIHNFIHNAQSGRWGVTGMIAFIIIAINMLRSVEGSFNDIWGVPRSRNWWYQISTYFTLIALGPVLLTAAISLAGGHYLHITQYLTQTSPVFGVVIAQLLPLGILWLTFTSFYLLIPNAKVHFSAAAMGGMVAGTLWHLNNLFGFLYVSRVVSNSRLYGSIGLIPVFMLALYFSWVILLFGAQVAYAFQNRTAYLQDKIADNVNQRGREFVALRIMTLLGRRFQNGEPPLPVLSIATELCAPSRLVQKILRILAAARLVTEVNSMETGGESAYMPARPLESINAHHVLLALRTCAGTELPFDHDNDLAVIYGEFARIEEAERLAAEKITVLALAQRLPARLTLETESATAEKAIAAARPLEKNPAAADTPAPPKSIEPAPFELETIEEPQPTAPAAIEEPAPSREINSDAVKEPAHRETARPGETEFPL